jgi:hypothetical protein
MYETNYHRASSVENALDLFKKGSDAKYLAGGQTLLPVMKQRLAQPSDVIDSRAFLECLAYRPVPMRSSSRRRQPISTSSPAQTRRRPFPPSCI